MKNNLKKNIIWNAFGNIIYLGCQWLVTVFVTRFAGYEDAGILSLAMSISATFQTIALFGIRNYQVSDVNNKYTNDCYVSMRIITCTVALILCMLFTFINGYTSRQIISIFCFMLYRLAENFSDVLHGIAQKEDRLDIAGKCFAIKGIETILLFLFGFIISDDLNCGLFFMAIGSVITTLIYDFVSVRKISKFNIKMNFTELISLIKETFPLCIYLFLIATIATVPKYILDKMCDETALGAYSSVFAPALIIQAAASYIFNPFAGEFAKYYKNNEIKKFWKLFGKLNLIISIASLVIILFASILGKYALTLIFGNSISQYTYLLIPILFCVVFYSFLSFFGMLSVIVRDFKNLIISCIVGFIFCGFSTPIFIKLTGINGTSYGLIFGSITACVLLLFTLKKDVTSKHK